MRVVNVYVGERTSWFIISLLLPRRPAPGAGHRWPIGRQERHDPTSQPGNVIVQPVADISSSGDRFWAASNGAVVTSTDGSAWTPVDVPTGGLAPTRIQAAAGGNLALRLSTNSNDRSNDRWISISHDDGNSWSAPVELPADAGYATAVGPAGAAVITSGDGRDGFDGRHALSLIVDDGVAFTVDLPSTSCCESVAVGDDRVLLRTDQTLDVFQLDGILIHRTTWTGDIGGWTADG